MTAAITAFELASLPDAVRDLLVTHGIGDAPLRFAAPSSTWLDTGGWLRGGQVWAAVVGDQFVLAAAGPRPAVFRLPVTALANAVYNHITGELSFPPLPSGSGIPPIGLDPHVARTLISLAPPPAPISPGTPSDA